MVDQPRAITLGAALVFAAGLAGSGATLAVANGATESTSAASIACTANGGSVTAIATEHGSRCEHGAAAPPTSSPGATPGSPTTGISDNMPMNIDVPPGQTTDAASITAATASATAVGEQGEAAAAETPLGTTRIAVRSGGASVSTGGVSAHGTAVSVNVSSGEPGGPTVSVGIPSRVGMPSG
jgi:hypothetical protein